MKVYFQTEIRFFTFLRPQLKVLHDLDLATTEDPTPHATSS